MTKHGSFEEKKTEQKLIHNYYKEISIRKKSYGNIDNPRIFKDCSFSVLFYSYRK